MTNRHYRAFGSLFFLLHQDRILRLLNAPVIGRWFRYALRINGESSAVGSLKIDRILPHAIFWWHGDKQLAEFRTHAKFSKRLYYAFRPLWWAMHTWDWCVADRWVPQLSFGFTTLTKYPDPDPETNTVDGSVEHNVGTYTTWAAIRDGAGTGAYPTVASEAAQWIAAGDAAGTWQVIARGIFLFDTSALTADASISATVLSLYGQSKQDVEGWTPNLDIYTSAPASNTDLVAGDFDSLGTVSQTGSPITYASFSTAGYNDFTFNATGKGNVSKTGVSKFGSRNANYDVANSAPAFTAFASNGIAVYYADQAGTANDPKLVVEYSLSVSLTPPAGSLSASGIALRNDRGIFVPTEVDA